MTLRPLRILVVDDELSVQLIEQCLSAAGESMPTKLEHVCRGTEALARLEEHNHDILLCDYAAGIEEGVLEEVRKRGISTPVILTTWQGGEQIAVEALRAGAAEYLSKAGLSPDALLSALRRVVELQRKRHQRSERHQRSAAEDALCGGEEMNRALLDNLPQAICCKDHNLALVSANARFASLFGATPENLIGKTDYDLFSRPRAEKHRAHDLRVIKSREPECFEETFKVNGEERTFEITKMPLIQNNDKVSGVLGIFTDVTFRKGVEQSLRESQHWFQTVFEASRDGIVVELDEVIVYANSSFARMYGYDSPDELVGHHISVVQSEEDNERMLELGRQRLRGEAVQSIYTFRGKRKNGGKIEMEASVSSISIGDKSYIVSLVRDISERRQAERKIQSTLSLFGATLESTADGILVVDRMGKITTFNKTFLQMWRIPASVAAAMDDARALEYMLAQVKDPKRVLSKIIDLYSRPDVESHDLVEFRDGRVFERYSLPQRIGDEIVGRVWSFRDITERRTAEEALRFSEERYRLLFEYNPQPMFVYDSENLSFLAVNNALITQYGYSREEFLSMTLRDIRPAEDISTLLESAARSSSGLEISERARHRKKDGSIIEVELTSNNFIVGERPGRLVLATDITERRDLEEQLRLAQKMEGIGRLAGGIAHDFNNLLTTVLGYSDLLLEEVKDGDKLHSDIIEIKKAGERAASLTRQLLAFSRRQVLQPTVLDLNAVVAELDKMLRRLIGEDIELVSVNEDQLGRVKADAGQVEQVIVNLVVNARDAMPAGGRITIETSNVELDETYARQHVSVVTGRYVMLSVSDTGLGMDAETKARIFEPFFTTKDRSKGTGLGLSTVYGIVKQSGGNIWVYSEPGLGTTFKVYLPRVDEPIYSPELPATQPKAIGGSETILLVEDEDSVRSLAREILQRNGYSVLEATHGSEALVICKQHPGTISLMLTDVVMPGMSGREVAEKLSPMRPEMKVLFMSGYSDNAIVRHGILEPGTQFLPKPYTPDALIRKVRDVLDENSSERSVK